MCIYIYIYIYTHTHTNTHTHTHTHTHNGILLSHKNNEILPFATTWMDLEGRLSEIPDRKRQMPYDFTYIWNRNNKTNEQPKQNRNRHIDTN